MILLEFLFKIWEAIVKKYKLIILEVDLEKGFWLWVFKNLKIEIFIIEGEKKVGVLLIKNLMVILLFGIWNGRRYKNKEERIGEYFILELEVLVIEGRKIFIIFDSDKKELIIK